MMIKIVDKIMNRENKINGEDKRMLNHGIDNNYLPTIITFKSPVKNMYQIIYSFLDD